MSYYLAHGSSAHRSATVIAVSVTSDCAIDEVDAEEEVLGNDFIFTSHDTVVLSFVADFDPLTEDCRVTLLRARPLLDAAPFFGFVSSGDAAFIGISVSGEGLAFAFDSTVSKTGEAQAELRILLKTLLWHCGDVIFEPP